MKDLVMAEIRVNSLVKILPEIIAENMEEGETKRESNPREAAWLRGRASGLEWVLTHLTEVQEWMKEE